MQKTSKGLEEILMKMNDMENKFNILPRIFVYFQGG